ncbi:pyridoxal-dependent decarboxylase [Vitiosangium sp. GDMCC 1.1324]|uniref:pyridoxal-dependent decarboxylase n=1 Tax=Vitiosangium sp. (strain GDMCC 1.1324) TaxID=2138576 RepID=UPI00130DFB1E|nr:pyridoxal-dependent decarboxylase [Vitiosangium sp. GDMCC 1.1324]
MSSSTPVLEHLFSLEACTPEQQRLLLSLLGRLLASEGPARASSVLPEQWERAGLLDDDGRRVEPRELPARGESLEAVVEQLLYLMKGPPSGVSLPGVIGAVTTLLASGGEARREEGLRVDDAESRVAAMVSRVVGYDEARSGGRTTWSARAAVLAGLRVAIAKHAPEARRKGVPRNLYCFAVEGGDDALLEAVETTGIGGYHLIRVRKREDGTMNPADLRAKMLAVVAGGDVPIYVVAAAGAEGSSAMDDVRELREVVDSITSLYGLRPVHLHADAAWGGLYCVFNGYDFHGNPLGFEPRVLESLAHLRARLRHLHLADSVGLDFRWLGRASFPAGLFLLGHGVELRSVSLRSLEAPSALALHAQLRAIGLEGYRRLLAEVLLEEDAARSGRGLGLAGVSTGAGSSSPDGSRAIAGLSTGLAPGMVAYSGARPPRARPRN